MGVIGCWVISPFFLSIVYMAGVLCTMVSCSHFTNPAIWVLGVSKMERFIYCFTHGLVFVYVCSGKPCPPFKIVILDEADSMTSAAQVILTGHY